MDTIPLPTLLSQVLVAFTIEFDNAFEQRMPHTTTMGRRAGEPARGPWLVSMPMWSTFMKFVPPEGIPVSDLLQRGFLPDRVLNGRNPGMVRWGYVTLDAGVVRATAAGRRAQDIWRTLSGTIEDRWIARFGPDTMAALRGSLSRLLDRVDVELPDYVPENGAHDGRVAIAPRPLAERLPAADLSALLAKALVVFTLDFERESPQSLVMSANAIRVLADEAPLRELPRLTGVAPETLGVMLRFLEKHGIVTTDAIDGRKVTRLTTRGHTVRRDYLPRVAAVEDQWKAGFGAEVVSVLRTALESLVGDTNLERSPLAAAVEPPPECWRAKVRKAQVLPHHPAVSHRGGYPDGS